MIHFSLPSVAAMPPLFACAALAQTPPVMTPAELGTRLAGRPAGADAEALASQTRAWFGAENLKNGPNPKVDELTVAWAVEVSSLPAGALPAVVSEDGAFRLALARIGNTNVYAARTLLPDGTAMRWSYQLPNGAKIGDVRQLEVYKTHPDTREQPNVPKGTVTQQAKWKSNVFAGTERDWWIYVPAQYKAAQPAAVMVFQDGGGPKNWVPTVFDNLIARGEMPVTVGIFINPGTFPADNNRSNRSVEYDTLSDAYVRFLTEEILPEVEKTAKLRHDAAGRAICGVSSGGICAFTAAWQRPDQFGKVASFVGSFVNLQGGKTGIEGGHNYPTLIRKTKNNPKPIRAFLGDGANDLDNPFGNWPLANMEMDKALTFAGYDHQFVFGQGFHGDRQMRAIFPDTLRWLWRDWREAAPTTAAAKP